MSQLPSLLPAFAEPVYLALLYAVGAAFFLCFIVVVAKKLLAPMKTHTSCYPLVPKAKFWLFVCGFMALMTVALAQPYAPGVRFSLKGKGVDVIVIMDSTISMLADDVSPNRFEVAKREISNLKDIVGGEDRLAFFVFGSVSLRKIGLSKDADRFLDEVQQLELGESEVANDIVWDTDLPLVLGQVLESLQLDRSGSAGRQKIVFLFTDGDNQVDDQKKLDRFLGVFRKNKIGIFPVGIGTEKGVKLLSIVKNFRKGEDYLESLEEEWNGRYTRLGTRTLNQIASKTSGRAFFVSGGNVSASQFLRGIIESQRRFSVTQNESRTEENQELWWYVLSIATALLTIGILLY